MTPDDIAIDLDNFTGVDDLIDDPSAHVPVEPIEAGLPGEEIARRYVRWRHGAARELAKWERAYAEETARIKLFYEDRTAAFRRRIADLDAQVEAWQRATGAKTFPTPWGTSRLNAPRAHVAVVDADEFVKWAVANERFDLLRLEPAKGELARLEKGPVAMTDLEEPGPDGAMVVVKDPETGEPVAVAMVTEDTDGRLCNVQALIFRHKDETEVVPGVALLTPVTPSFSPPK